VRTIAEMNMLIRAWMEVPAGLQLTTDQFREGWEIVQPEEAGELKRKMRTSERKLIRMGICLTHPTPRCGVSQW